MFVTVFGAAGRVSPLSSPLSRPPFSSLVGKTPPLPCPRRTSTHQQVAPRRQLATRSSGGARLAACRPSSTRSVAGGIFGGTQPHLPKAVRACKSIRPERSLEQRPPGCPPGTRGSTRSASEYLCIPSLSFGSGSGPNSGHDEWSAACQPAKATAPCQSTIITGQSDNHTSPSASCRKQKRPSS